MKLAQLAVFGLLLGLVESTAFGQDAPPDWLEPETWPKLVRVCQLEIHHEDEPLLKLLKERCNAAHHELRGRYLLWMQGEQTLTQVFDAAQRFVEARVEAGGPGSDTRALLAEKVTFAKFVEKQVDSIWKKYERHRQIPDKHCATYFRAHAEIELLRAQNATNHKQVE